MAGYRPTQIRMPANETEFEKNCVVRFRGLLKDPNAKRFGTRGQRQHGIDILGRRDRDARQIVGVLRKSGRLGNEGLDHPPCSITRDNRPSRVLSRVRCAGLRTFQGSGFRAAGATGFEKHHAAGGSICTAAYYYCRHVWIIQGVASRQCNRSPSAAGSPFDRRPRIHQHERGSGAGVFL
jgi:hypothetical protein